MGTRTGKILRDLRRQPMWVQAVALVAAGSLIGGVTVASTRETSSTRTPAEIAVGAEGAPGTIAGDGSVGADGTAAPAPPGGALSGPGGSPGGPAPAGGGQTGTTGTGSGAGGTTSLRLTASDRGVTAKTIKVAFPWFSSESSDEITGTNAQIEDQEDAIRAYVADVNRRGGILGRQIVPLIEEYDPTSGGADMQAKCERWASDDKVFAVVDGVGAWHGVYQTCLANLKTPLLSGWTTVTSHAKAGAPYIWWWAASAEDIIDHMVGWANSTGLITKANQAKVAMAFSDRPGDQQALKHMQAVLKRRGLSIALEVIPFNNAAAQAALPGAIQRMKEKNIEKVIMMLPFTAFTFWLNHSKAQSFFPRYLLSDYESAMVVAEALLGPVHPDSLHGAIGPVSLNLGVKDEASAYWAEEKRCNAIWRAAYRDEDHVDLQRGGVGFRWCQGITLFAEAAKRATLAGGGALTRLRWASDGIATLKEIPSPMTPTLSWSPGDYSGTEWMKIVEVRTSGCPRELDIDENGSCHVEVEPFARIKRS